MGDMQDWGEGRAATRGAVKYFYSALECNHSALRVLSGIPSNKLMACPPPSAPPKGGAGGWTCGSSTKPTEIFTGAAGILSDVGRSWAALSGISVHWLQATVLGGACGSSFRRVLAVMWAWYWGGIGWNWSPSDVLGLHANRFSGPVAHAPSPKGRHTAAR